MKLKFDLGKITHFKKDLPFWLQDGMDKIMGQISQQGVVSYEKIFSFAGKFLNTKSLQGMESCVLSDVKSITIDDNSHCASNTANVVFMNGCSFQNKSSFQDNFLLSCQMAFIALDQSKILDSKVLFSRIYKWDFLESVLEHCQSNMCLAENLKSQGSVFQSLDVKWTQFYKDDFESCSFKDVTFEKTRWNTCHFKSCVVENVAFKNCSFENCQFTNVQLKAKGPVRLVENVHVSNQEFRNITSYDDFMRTLKGSDKTSRDPVEEQAPSSDRQKIRPQQGSSRPFGEGVGHQKRRPPHGVRRPEDGVTNVRDANTRDNAGHVNRGRKPRKFTRPVEGEV